ncbi:MAG: dodecin domain-containing protein [Verrucomicrobiales bacterium]|nr:dodecin domain-containing protein [Verrucomicrobiales bacterium]
MSSVVKVIELIAESDTSWEEAARVAVETAGRTIHGIRSLYVNDLQAVVREGKIERFRLNAKISFEVDP